MKGIATLPTTPLPTPSIPGPEDAPLVNENMLKTTLLSTGSSVTRKRSSPAIKCPLKVEKPTSETFPSFLTEVTLQGFNDHTTL